MSHELRSAAQAEKDAIVFKALANPVRLQIVSLVAASSEGQVSAGNIVERFSLSQPTISHHLRVLREAGVLTTHKSSTFVYYRFAPQLRETVAAVLPGAAAAEPPSSAPPRARKSPAPAVDAPDRAAAAAGDAVEVAEPDEPKKDKHKDKSEKKKDKKSKKSKKK